MCRVVIISRSDRCLTPTRRACRAIREGKTTSRRSRTARSKSTSALGLCGSLWCPSPFSATDPRAFLLVPFSAGKYVEAIDALQKLSEEIAPERDVKVQHNLVLAGYVSGKYGAKDFEHSLRNLLSALASDDNDKKRSDVMDAASLERESSFIRYNLAAALFQQKQYAAASGVLDVLLRNIEPIDERVAMHVCFLFLDIILHSTRGCVATDRERYATVKKAQAIVAYLEKPHGFNGQLLGHGSADDGSAAASNGSASAGGGGGDAGGADAAAQQQAKKESLDVVEFRFRLHLYKSKLMLLLGNLKTAKKEVKSALEILQKEIKPRGERGDESGGAAASAEKTSTAIGHPSLAVQKSTGLFLKANLEYLRTNYKKCIKLLASCVQPAVDESIFLNNMGCIHFQMGQRKAAQSYFARALDASSKPRRASQEAVVISVRFLRLYHIRCMLHMGGLTLLCPL
jgi:CCR4-NOT transcription complex subunit 10